MMSKLIKRTKTRPTAAVLKAREKAAEAVDMIQDMVIDSMSSTIDTLLQLQSAFVGEPSQEIDFGQGVTASLKRPKGRVYWGDRLRDLTEYAEMASTALGMQDGEALQKILYADGWRVVGRYLRSPAWMIPLAEVDRHTVAREHESWVVDAIFASMSEIRLK